MGLLSTAKGLSEKVLEKATDFSSDELIANTIIKAVEKQEKVNKVLASRGSNYRVTDMNLQMGIPPTVEFGVRRVSDDEPEVTAVTPV